MYIAPLTSIEGSDDLENEVRVYRRLENGNGTGKRLFSSVIEAKWGEVYGYLALPFYPISLEDALRLPDIQPLSMSDVRRIFRQIAEAIAYLHSLALVHTDMKPANVMLRSCATRIVPSVELGGPAKVKMIYQMRTLLMLTHCQAELISLELVIIDLAMCTSAETPGLPMIGTNAYRPPEVTLGLRWNAAVDMFAIGCILAELCVGQPLFPAAESIAERLKMLERVIEPIPSSMARQVQRRFPRLLTVVDGAVRVIALRRHVRESFKIHRASMLQPLQNTMEEQSQFTMIASTLCSSVVAPYWHDSRRFRSGAHHREIGSNSERHIRLSFLGVVLREPQSLGYAQCEVNQSSPVVVAYLPGTYKHIMVWRDNVCIDNEIDTQVNWRIQKQSYNQAPIIELSSYPGPALPVPTRSSSTYSSVRERALRLIEEDSSGSVDSTAVALWAPCTCSTTLGDARVASVAVDAVSSSSTSMSGETTVGPEVEPAT
ncbi:kinase-like domain-containing protein [Cerioporus squamosus]|nr:kinase-like domain-containing protein [Cerioporus squamosus]